MVVHSPVLFADVRDTLKTAFYYYLIANSGVTLLHISALIRILFCLDVEVMMLFIPFKSQCECVFPLLCSQCTIGRGEDDAASRPHHKL